MNLFWPYLSGQTCSHGTACNFIHCFRNPGGDYEWADWDNPPPKYWIRKMAVLFGHSDESTYGKQMELRDFESPKDSDRKRTPRHGIDRFAFSHSVCGELSHFLFCPFFLFLSLVFLVVPPSPPYFSFVLPVLSSA